MPIDPAMQELVNLQLQHPVANDCVPHVQDHPNLQEDHNIMENLPIQLPVPHHLGVMNNRCPHCEAKYFKEECTTQRIFNKCCFQGKARLPPLQLPAQAIIEIFTGDTPQAHDFLENIRLYNAAPSMASWNAQVREHAGRGPRAVTIHCQPYHLTAAQEAREGQPPQYAQLYILDTNEALQKRINDPHNLKIRPDIIQLLQDELMAVNPYASAVSEYGSNPPETTTNCC